MQTNFKRGFWMMALVIGSLNLPFSAARAEANGNASAEPVCKKEVRTGSRIPVRVCEESSTGVQTLEMSEQIIHPTDLDYVLSAGFPGLNVNSGTGSGGNLRQ